MMAGGVDGGAGDFWLPSDFLGEDVFHRAAEPRDLWTDRRFPADHRGLFHSNLRYQEEVESDEDYLAGLTRRMAHAFVLDDEDSLSQLYPKMKAGSPQSTLCDPRIWNGSRNVSPNGASQVCSPPATPFEQQEDAWDLLTAAAGQVVRLRLMEEARRQKLQGRGLLTPPGKPAGVPVPAPHKSSRGTGVYCSPHLTQQQQQLQIERFYQLKQQQLLKQQASTGRPQSRDGAVVGGVGYVEELAGRHVGLPSPAWAARHHRQHSPPPPPYQPRLGPGFHAAAAAAALHAGARKESTGTGVFLPRRPGNPSEPRRKPASPAVLPERMIHYRNPNADGLILDSDVLVARGNRYLAHQQQQKRNQQYRPQVAASPDLHDNHIRLPAEWTY